MTTPFHHANEAQTRYALMERNAGVMIVSLFLLTVVAALFFRPSIWFILGSAVSGLLIFFSWHTTLRQRFYVSGALAICSVLLALLSIIWEFRYLDLATMLVLGLPPVALGLYAGILTAKIIRNRQSNEV